MNEVSLQRSYSVNESVNQWMVTTSLFWAGFLSLLPRLEHSEAEALSVPASPHIETLSLVTS